MCCIWNDRFFLLYYNKPITSNVNVRRGRLYLKWWGFTGHIPGLLSFWKCPPFHSVPTWLVSDLLSDLSYNTQISLNEVSQHPVQNTTDPINCHTIVIAKGFIWFDIHHNREFWESAACNLHKRNGFLHVSRHICTTRLSQLLCSHFALLDIHIFFCPPAF